MKKGIRLIGVASVAFFLFTGGLAAQSLSSYVRTDKPEAVIDIRAGQQSSFRIPRTVYGATRKTAATGILRAFRPSFSKTQAWRITTPACRY